MSQFTSTFSAACNRNKILNSKSQLLSSNTFAAPEILFFFLLFLFFISWVFYFWLKYMHAAHAMAYKNLNSRQC